MTKLTEAVRANDLEQLKTLRSNESFNRFELANALFSASYRNIEAGAKE